MERSQSASIRNVRQVLSLTLHSLTVADPGFPQGGGANSPGGAPTYDFAKFPQKLHEIERIWAPPGGVPRVPLDPPLTNLIVYKNINLLFAFRNYEASLHFYRLTLLCVNEKDVRLKSRCFNVLQS